MQQLEAVAGTPTTITTTQAADAAGVPTWSRSELRFEEDSTDCPGLALTNETTISGTPTTAGRYHVRLVLWDMGAPADTWTLDLAVAPAPGTPVDPVPETPEDGEPETPEDHPLAAREAAYLGRPGDRATIDLANAHLPIVTAFVYGYTRGRGFTTDGDPRPDLAAVIVSAAARLVSNPEQLHQYTTGDYTERPAVLNGWTLTELAVLHNHRKRAG